MATLLFAAAGAAIGGQIGGTVLGVTAAAIGTSVGASIGGVVDQFAINALRGRQRTRGPRLGSLDVQQSNEGPGLPTVDGFARLTGNIIWSTRLEEVQTTEEVGGKGGGAEVTNYSYFANFAIALCDTSAGPVRHFGRIWADGKPLDPTDLTIRYYKGTETQTPDPLIVAKDGAAPAYRGTAYLVFERMPLAEFGNRIPNIAVEVWGQSGDVESLITSINIIPGSTEFGYSPEVITRGNPQNGYENATRYNGVSDWTLSLDHAQAVLPNLDRISLIVAWFGDDLRAGETQIQPRVELKGKATRPRSWGAAGLTRETAPLVSQIDGRAAFGSTPDDQSVIDAIADAKARGLAVTLYPFILMDIPADNALPAPDGIGTQPPYPWRGRITTAAGGGTVASQAAAFLGTAAAADFTDNPGAPPTYSGPAEWSFRRHILHMAALARAAGGVDTFLIGSEMIGMTQATDTEAAYPFVDGLVALAAQVRAILPGAAISYAADWSEYHSHRPAGGGVYFNLDPLWSNAEIDFIGVDNYFPLSDWRRGDQHSDYDAANGVTSPYDLDYLTGQIEGGEYFDYFYANEAARNAQIRTPIIDGLNGDDWVFANKAFRQWRSNSHANRLTGGGTVATAWVPNSKPFRFTEFGCPAVDLGANQPNVFVDAKSPSLSCRISRPGCGMISSNANICAPGWSGFAMWRAMRSTARRFGRGTPGPGLSSRARG